jgi:hypothetical protein
MKNKLVCQGISLLHHFVVVVVVKQDREAPVGVATKKGSKFSVLAVSAVVVAVLALVRVACDGYES